MQRVIRVESANIETREKRQKKIDSFSKDKIKKADSDDSVLVVPAGYLKTEK